MVEDKKNSQKTCLISWDKEDHIQEEVPSF